MTYAWGETHASGRSGAEPHGRSAERSTYRDGYRDRPWARVGAEADHDNRISGCIYTT